MTPRHKNPSLSPVGNRDRKRGSRAPEPKPPETIWTLLDRLLARPPGSVAAAEVVDEIRGRR